MLAKRLGFGMVIPCRAASALRAEAKTMVIVNGGVPTVFNEQLRVH
jgi:hypothetical protein